MFRIEKETTNDADKINLIGSINEDVDFKTVFGPLSKNLEINCRQVTRLNSMGIKGWCLFFQGLRDSGAKISFYECVPALVEQCNFLSNLMLTPEVVSICLRYICPSCDSEHTEIAKVVDLKMNNITVPTVNCQSCKTEMEFDEIPSQYFSFLRRK